MDVSRLRELGGPSYASSTRYSYAESAYTPPSRNGAEEPLLGASVNEHELTERLHGLRQTEHEQPLLNGRPTIRDVSGIGRVTEIMTEITSEKESQKTDANSSLSHGLDTTHVNVAATGVPGDSPGGDIAKSHTPWVLRRTFLSGLLLVLQLFIISLEVLRYVSVRGQGISTSTQNLHYLWTYGPTAVFSILAICWSKVEYHTKLLLPWKMMSQPQPAERSVLLDYLSPNQAIGLYKSARARDYAVVVAILGSLFVIAATIVSTGLFVLRPLMIIHTGVPIEYKDDFQLSTFDASLMDSVPLLLAIGLLGNLSISPPAGTNVTWSAQSFNVSDHLQGSNLTVTAAAKTFTADLDCHEVQVTNGTLEADNLLNLLRMNLTMDGCDAGQVTLAVPGGPVDGVFSVGRMLLLQCLDTSEARTADQESHGLSRRDISGSLTTTSHRGKLSDMPTSSSRVTTSTAASEVVTTLTSIAHIPSMESGITTMIPVQTATVTLTSTLSPATSSSSADMVMAMAFAQFSHPAEFPHSQTVFSTTSLGPDILNATVLFCKPTYQSTRTEVTLDAAGSLINIVPNGTLSDDDMPAWDLVAALENSLSYSLQALVENTIAVHNIGEDTVILNAQFDPFFNVLRTISPSVFGSDFLDPTLLEHDARQLFRAYSAQIAKKYLTRTLENTTANASFERLESRLVVHDLSLRLLESFLALIMACSFTLIFLGPGGKTPGSPSTMARMATILARSDQLMSSLAQTGESNMKVISQCLSTSTFSVPPAEASKDMTYQIQSLTKANFEMIGNKDNNMRWWQPIAFKIPFKIVVLILPLTLMVILETTYQISRRSYGLCNVSENSHFAWTIFPATVLTIFKLLGHSLAWGVGLLDPYMLLKHGTPSGKNALFCSHTLKSALELLYTSTRMRRPALAASALLITIGPFLTIVVSGLFSTQFLPGIKTVKVSLADRLPLVPYDHDWESGTLAAANLLIRGAYSYPVGTYENIVYPLVDWKELNTSHSAEEAMYNATTMSMNMESLKPGMDCIVVDPTHVMYNFTRPSKGRYDIEFTYLELASCTCGDFDESRFACDTNKTYIPSFGGGFQTNESMFWGFFEDRLAQSTWTRPSQWRDSSSLIEAKNSQLTTCPNITAIYANFDETSVDLTVIQCSWHLDQVFANVTYDFQQQAVSSASVLDVLNTTSEAESYPFQSTISTYMDEYTHTFEDEDLPNLFMALLNGSDSATVFTRENGPRIAESMGFIYTTFAAQYINAAHRAPPLTGSHPGSANITNTGRERLVQNLISTRILEGLLAIMWLCIVVAYVLFDVTQLLPKDPCSIAAQASLFAGSELLQLIPEGAEWCTDEELMQLELFRDHFFSLGWWDKHGEEGKTRRFGIDVGKPG